MPVWSYGFVMFFCLSSLSSTSDLLRSKGFDLKKMHYKQLILKPLSTLNPARERAVGYYHVCRTGLAHEHKKLLRSKTRKTKTKTFLQRHLTEMQSHNCPEWLGGPILKACLWVDFPTLSTITYKLLTTLFFSFKKKKKRKLNKQVLEGHTNRWMKVYILWALFLWKPLSRKLTGTKLSTAAVFMLLFIFRMVDMKVCSPWRPGLWLCLTSVKCHPSSRFIINPKMIETVGKAGQMLWPWPKERQLSHALPSNNPGSCLSIITKWACFLPNPF